MRDDDIAAHVSEALAGVGFRTLVRSPSHLEVESRHGTVSIRLPTADVQRFLASSAAAADEEAADRPSGSWRARAHRPEGS